MRATKRRRERTGSLSPPLRASYGASSGSAVFADRLATSSPAPPSPSTFIGLIQYRNNTRHRGSIGNASTSSDDPQRRVFVMRHNYVHMQALQEVLRRTSLAEMRDREVVEWLLGTEKWLREFHQPLLPPDTVMVGGAEGHMGGGSTADTSFSSGLPFSAPSATGGDGFTRAYSSALSELRLLVIGVLHTMPWWRVVETVAKPHGGGAFGAEAGGGGGQGILRGTLHDQSSGGGGGGHSSGGGGGATGLSAATAGGRSSAARAVMAARRGNFDNAAAADRAAAVRHAITRWHVRLQIAFERVCLVLIEKSQRTVQGVLEVLLKPCQLRPPVRDGARRSIPSDSFIRVLNAVAMLYGSPYVMELLESCIADFMPRKRWAERRHHVACTAVLLYVALEGHTPAYNPRLGNSQSLQRAIDLLKSLRPCRDEGLEQSPWRLPRATRSSSLALGAATSEDSGPDVGGGGGGDGSSSATPGRPPRQPTHSSRGLVSMLPGSGVLPAGYVSATLMEDARSGGLRGLRQPALLRPGGAMATASDTEVSEGGASRENVGGQLARSSERLAANRGDESENSSTAASLQTRVKPSSSGEGAGDTLLHGGEGGELHGAAAKSSAALTTASLIDVSVEHNNKLLAHRNTIIRVLLNRLLAVEQTLDPCEDASTQQSAAGEASLLAKGRWTAQGSFRAAGSSPGSPFGSAPPSRSASPSRLFPASAAASMSMQGQGSGTSGGPSVLFPSTPACTIDGVDAVTATSSALSSPAALSPAGTASGPQSYLLLSSPASFASNALLHAPHRQRGLEVSFGAGVAQPLEGFFHRLSLPYLRILRDCTTLVYGRLADDLRRQQVAGSCGNADWWAEILYFYLTVVTRVERPVYLLYLAPSLAMLGTEDESVNLLHKLITLVTKGSMPVEQPRTTVLSAAGGAGVAGGLPAARLPSMQAAQPVRLRMAAPTGVSRRLVTMEERLLAARHIFPLFRFLRSRLDEASGEGVRRRLLKWTAHELRRLGGAGLTISANTSFTGGAYARGRPQAPSRESRLALVTFAQCAAISELMEVDILPAALVPPAQGEAPSTGKGEGGRFTATSVSGDASDSIAVALQPLLARYTLQTEQPEDPNDDGGDDGDAAVAPTDHDSNEEMQYGRAMREGSTDSSASSTASVPPRKRATGKDRRGRRGGEGDEQLSAVRRQLDLRQMEFEGLLQPLLMANCPWQAWLR